MDTVLWERDLCGNQKLSDKYSSTLFKDFSCCLTVIYRCEYYVLTHFICKEELFNSVQDGYILNPTNLQKDSQPNKIN